MTRLKVDTSDESSSPPPPQDDGYHARPQLHSPVAQPHPMHAANPPNTEDTTQHPGGPCTVCGATTTSQWRTDPDTGAPLCQSDGLAAWRKKRSEATPAEIDEKSSEKPGGPCAICGATVSCLWRPHPQTGVPLCNADGVRAMRQHRKTHGKSRRKKTGKGSRQNGKKRGKKGKAKKG